MNTLANGGAAFFLYAFAFLEKAPTFKCQLSPTQDVWTFSTTEEPLHEEYCAVLQDSTGRDYKPYNCEVDWEHPESIYNILW
jgi:hypothetical protein